MLAIGTFVLGDEKESKSDALRSFTATEWTPHYDRKEKSTRHHTVFVTLKFMGYKKDDITNYKKGDTVFVSGRYTEEPYMGTLERDGYQHSNAKEGYEPRSGAEIMVESMMDIQFSKDSKDSLGITPGSDCGWGQKARDGGSGNSRSSNGNSSGGSRSNNSGGNQRSNNNARSNSAQQNRNQDNDDDFQEQEPSRNSNSRQERGTDNRDSGRASSNTNNSRNQGRNAAPTHSDAEVDESEFDDLALPDD